MLLKDRIVDFIKSEDGRISKKGALAIGAVSVISVFATLDVALADEQACRNAGLGPQPWWGPCN